MVHNGALLKYPIVCLTETGPEVARSSERHCFGTPAGFYGGYFENRTFIDSEMFQHSVLSARIKRYPGFFGSITAAFFGKWNPFFVLVEVEREYERGAEPLDLQSVKTRVADSLMTPESVTSLGEDDECAELIAQLAQCGRFADIVDCLEAWGR